MSYPNQNLFNTLQNVCGHISLQDEMDEIIQAVEKDNCEFQEALKLLRELVDIQNDAPLEQDREEWEDIMKRAYKFLNKHGS
jgi:hypothetical protein